MKSGRCKVANTEVGADFGNIGYFLAEKWAKPRINSRQDPAKGQVRVGKKEDEKPAKSGEKGGT